jgi:hypothetical protein
MIKITIDKETLAKLRELREQSEFCDEHGATLGVFQPAPSRDRSLLRDMDVPVTAEDMQQIEKEIQAGKFYTTAEVLAHLQSLEKP